MRKLLGGVCLLMAFSFLAAPVEAQTAAATKIPSAHRYDAQNEITLNGTVTSVVSKPTTGLLTGVHLMLSTSSGKVDAYLGPFALKGKNAISVSAGQSVQAVGVMQTVKDGQVFVTRIVTASGQTYVFRNPNGFPVVASNGEPANTNPSVLGGQR